MKRLVCILILLVVVPSLLMATDSGIALATVSISFFSLGLGFVMLDQPDVGAWILGGFQIAVGILGIVLLATDSLGGDLLAQIREQVK